MILGISGAKNLPCQQHHSLRRAKQEKRAQHGHATKPWPFQMSRTLFVTLPFLNKFRGLFQDIRISLSRPHVAQVKRNQCQRAHSTLRRDHYLTVTASPPKINKRPPVDLAVVFHFAPSQGVLGSPLLLLSSSKLVF